MVERLDKDHNRLKPTAVTTREQCDPMDLYRTPETEHIFQHISLDSTHFRKQFQQFRQQFQTEEISMYVQGHRMDTFLLGL